MEKNFSVASANECKIIDTKMKEFIYDLKIMTVVTILAYCIIFEVPILILGFYPRNDVFIKASGLPTRKMPFSYYEDEVIDYIMKNDRTFDLRDFDYDSIDFNEIYSRKNKVFPQYYDLITLHEMSYYYDEANKKIIQDGYEKAFKKKADLGADAVFKEVHIWYYLAALLVILVGVGVYVFFIKRVSKVESDLKNNHIMVMKGVVVGKTYVNYKSSSHITADIKNMNGEKETLNISKSQYDIFENGDSVLLIKYKSGKGLYDKYDVLKIDKDIENVYWEKEILEISPDQYDKIEGED